MSKTTVTGKSRQLAIRCEFDILDWIAFLSGGVRGESTVTKEQLRRRMNEDIASGVYTPVGIPQVLPSPPPEPPKPTRRKRRKPAKKARRGRKV